MFIGLNTSRHVLNTNAVTLFNYANSFLCHQLILKVYTNQVTTCSTIDYRHSKSRVQTKSRDRRYEIIKTVKTKTKPEATC